VVTRTNTQPRAWKLLAEVPDPEIPVLSVLDLGIVRDVHESDDGREVLVVITPTYSGCPATEVIARDVRAALESSYDVVDVQTQLSPAWTTDWMSAAGRQKLREFGIEPPSGRANVINIGSEIGHRPPDHLLVDHVRSTSDRPEACPRCGSAEVEELAGFGSTPCKALWRCTSCREPFDYFKKH
jgi:ring-1,2-phenylacetyl-CoA epoxidase subunit PaaD